MIIVKLISGLGNQLFQYALARHLSLQRGVPLQLDVSFYRSQKLRNYSLDNYNIQATVATDKEVARLLDIYQDMSLYARVYRKLENIRPKYRKNLFKENEWWVYEPGIFKVTSNVYIDGYWQHYKYFEGLDKRVLKELTVRNRKPGAYDTILAQIQKSRCPVSIHVRRGDYITDKDAYDFMGVMPVSYYEKAVAYIKQHTEDPVFFVFSDDIQWCRKNITIQAPVHFVDAGSDTADYMELDAMSTCSHHIIANSSFSWWAAFLNQHPDKIVIAPEKWVVPEDINNKIKLQFPSWIKM